MSLFLHKKHSQNLSVFVWKISEKLSFFSESLTEQEKQELSQIPNPNKQLEFVAVRHLARIVCEENLGIVYQGISKDENGKPYFYEISYEISISHCLPYVAIALHPSQSVGVDIEKEQEKLLRVAPRVFSEKEMIFCKNDLRKTCILWSSKEALYKIYAKKGLTFQTDLLVENFDDLTKPIQAKIQTDTYLQSCHLYHHELEQGVHLCYGF